MSDIKPTVDKGSGIRLDLTINIPTILSMFALLATAITWVNGQISALNNQQLVTVGDVKVLQTQMNSVSLAQASLRNDTASQISQMRTEVRADLRDIKSSVEQIQSDTSRRTYDGNH